MGHQGKTSKYVDLCNVWWLAVKKTWTPTIPHQRLDLSHMCNVIITTREPLINELFCIPVPARYIFELYSILSIANKKVMRPIWIENSRSHVNCDIICLWRCTVIQKRIVFTENRLKVWFTSNPWFGCTGTWEDRLNPVSDVTRLENVWQHCFFIISVRITWRWR
jgi:hypothetical protein